MDTPSNYLNNANSQRSIAVDPGTGWIHVATGGPDGLFHAWFDTSWHTEAVDGSSGVNCASLALDAGGAVHLAYYDSDNTDLKYATNAGGPWISETVDSAGNVGWSASIAVEGDGTAHIAYHDGDNGDLKYATNAGGSWAAETVDAADWVGNHASLALDAGGNAHISYYDATGFDLKYATNLGGSWSTEVADGNGKAGEYSSIAVDGSGNPHISYNQNHDGISTTNHLMYAWKSGASWTVETADGTAMTASYASLALDGDGKAHVSYQYTAGEDLMYATNASGTWATETIESDGPTGRFTSIALDAGGNSHISYHRQSDNDQKHATNAGGSWAAAVVADGGQAGVTNDLALDSSGHAHVCYHEATSLDLRYATNASGSWVLVTLDAGFLTETDCSIAVDGADKVHISYLGETGLVHADNTGGTWAFETLDAVTARHTSIAVDSGDRVHISYFDDTGDDLKYATNRSGSWAVETVDSSPTLGTVGQYTSIALDSADNPRISYHDWSNGDLKYAAWNGSSWSRETVDGPGSVGRYTSIALDSSDRPRIVYYNLDDGGLYHAAWNGSSWDVEMVATGLRGSIALNSRDEAQISFSGSLRHASDAGGSWVLSSLDDVTAGQTSIALDPLGRARISYFDNDNFDLKFAWYADDEPPAGTVTINGGDGYTRNANVSLTLSCQDGIGTGCSQMRFSHDGVSWSDPEPFSTARAWVLEPGEGSRTVYAQFGDAAGNWSGSQSDTIAVDLTAPTGTVTVNGGDAFTNNASVTLSLSAADPGGSGVGEMRFSNDAIVWSAWEPYAVSRSWSLVPGDGSKTVYVQFADAVRNVSGFPTDEIGLDTALPSVTLSIEGGAAATKSTSVSLGLAAGDTGGSGVEMMRFSNDGAVWSDWEAFSATAAWSLEAGEGSRTVWAQVRDAALNPSAESADSILVDQSNPTGTVTVNGGLPYASSQAVTLSLSAADTGGSGLGWMRFSNDGSVWSAWEPYGVSRPWSLSAGEGIKVVYAEFADLATNVSPAAWDDIVLDLDPVVHAEDFSDGDKTGDPDWEEARGRWLVNLTKRFVAKKPTVNVALIDSLLHPDTAALTSGSLEVDLRLTPLYVRFPNASLVFAYQDAGAYRYVKVKKRKLIIGQAGDGLGGEEAGVKAVLARKFALKRWYTLRVDLWADGLAEVHVNDEETPALSYAFGEAVPGRVGLKSQKAKVFFDNFTVYDESYLFTGP